jgi:Mitochondrial carrier protein
MVLHPRRRRIRRRRRRDGRIRIGALLLLLQLLVGTWCSFLGADGTAVPWLLQFAPTTPRRRQIQLSPLPMQSTLVRGGGGAILLRQRRLSSSHGVNNSSNKAAATWVDCVKTGIAGGIAGAVGTVVLYPLDAAKTVRQASPEVFRSVRVALVALIRNRTVFTGLATAVAGAVPSSALYFGTYEAAKQVLRGALPRSLSPAHNDTRWNRIVLHASAAATGNLVSSAVFVPKELIKQQLQYRREASTTVAAIVGEILRTKGISGLYTGYLATILRNVPSAALRFGLYEEFKRSILLESAGHHRSGSPGGDGADDAVAVVFSWRLFAAGAAAGAIASGVMTPVDVLKTRLSTGTCPVGLPSCVQHVIAENGVGALWAGAGSRMMGSALFSAIGFGTFEIAKNLLKVSRPGQDRSRRGSVQARHRPRGMQKAEVQVAFVSAPVSSQSELSEISNAFASVSLPERTTTYNESAAEATSDAPDDDAVPTSDMSSPQQQSLSTPHLLRLRDNCKDVLLWLLVLDSAWTFYSRQSYKRPPTSGMD